jgi:glycerophosphoryl diester phosphodiesterase
MIKRVTGFALLLLVAMVLAGCATPNRTANATLVQTGASPARMDFTTVKPLLHAHAHNDYLHEHPLFDALSNGFNSVEADIWLVDGQLLVAHDPFSIRKERSLTSLYLDPLAQIVKEGHGGVYGPGSRITLLIDIKSQADPTYRALELVLSRYKSMLSSFEGTTEHEGAITVIISGNRDLALMRAQPLRYAAYDGRMGDLNGNEPATLIPLISDRWTAYFTWDGHGAMPLDQLSRLKDIVARAHSHGRKLRFWDTPDGPGAARDTFWATLLDAGVDYLNTDDLAGLRAYLLGRNE